LCLSCGLFCNLKYIATNVKSHFMYWRTVRYCGPGDTFLCSHNEAH
jgi:hypothetical protein